MKKLLMFFGIVALCACSKTDEVSPGFNLNSVFEFLVFDSHNNDLLDPTTPDHYDEKDIKLFYVISGELIEVYDQNMSHPRNFTIYRHENEYRIRVFLNDSDASEKTITYIQWDDNDIDTIEATFRRDVHYCEVSKVWLNELEIWDLTMGDNQSFRLIK